MKLILAPHADDESLGCGGLLARFADDTSVAVLSDKDDGRMEEFLKAKEILGYREHYTTSFATGTLAANQRALVGWLDTLIRDIRPTELYIPSPDAHPDHAASYSAGIQAARKSYTAKGAWYVPTVMLYSVPSYSAALYTIPYQFTRYVALSEAHLDLKLAAISAYGSQNDGMFDPGMLAVEHARFVGAQANLPAAECYAVVREIVQ